jgi:hypothetical protein
MIGITGESDNYIAYQYLLSCYRKMLFFIPAFRNKFYKNTPYIYSPFLKQNTTRSFLNHKKQNKENVMKTCRTAILHFVYAGVKLGLLH